MAPGVLADVGPFFLRLELVPVRLNPSLARTLRAIREFDGDEEFANAFNDSDTSPISGMDMDRLASDLDELEEAGMIRVLFSGDRLSRVYLTSSGRDYLPNRVHDVAITVVKYLFQLLCGAAGGLVVWLLTSWLG